MTPAEFDRLKEVRQMLEGLTPWRRCMRKGCDGWTRGDFCPRHDPARLGRPVPGVYAVTLGKKGGAQ